MPRHLEPQMDRSTTTFFFGPHTDTRCNFLPPAKQTMPAPQSHGSGKRKHASDTPGELDAQKRPLVRNNQARNQSLITPHEAILSELAPKYDVLAASVISSTQIRKRVTYAANHLLDQAAKPRLVLLHARTADVGKMITVVEQCKRVLAEEGKSWYQFNQLFDLPEQPARKEVVEETTLETSDNGEDTDSSDHFETMNNRFAEALLPPPTHRSTKSLRIFLSTNAIPELRSKTDITLQSSETKT